MVCCGRADRNRRELDELGVAGVGTVTRGSSGKVQQGGCLMMDLLMQLVELGSRDFNLCRWKDWEYHLLVWSKSTTHHFLANRGLVRLGEHWDSLWEGSRAADNRTPISC